MDAFVERRANRRLATRRLIVSSACGKIFHWEVSAERASSAREKCLRHQIGQNLVNETNGKRIVAGAFDQVKFAVRQARRYLLGQPWRERSILRSMPKRDRHANFLERKSPGRRVNLRVGHAAVG